jgi:hypothetical protein
MDFIGWNRGPIWLPRTTATGTACRDARRVPSERESSAAPLRCCCSCPHGRRHNIQRNTDITGAVIPILASLPLRGDAGGIADLDPDAARCDDPRLVAWGGIPPIVTPTRQARPPCAAATAGVGLLREAYWAIPRSLDPRRFWSFWGLRSRQGEGHLSRHAGMRPA